MQDYTTMFFIVASFVGPVLFWFIIILIISRIGGWNKIAERFSYTGFTGETSDKKRYQSIKMGMSNYSGIVHFQALSQGLQMSVMFLFRPGHGDILIPWQELQAEENKGILHNMYKFSFMSLPGRYFYTYKILGEWILEKKKEYVA